MSSKRAVDLVIAIVGVSGLAAAGVVAMRMRMPVQQQPPYERVRTIKPPAHLAETSSRIGPPEAPLQVVEFSDFECPFCRQFHSRLKALLRQFSGRVALAYRQYPSPKHFHAYAAALSAACAAQGHHFEAYADLLFAKQDSLGLIPWDALATRAEIRDTVGFNQCRSSKYVQDLVNADIRLGRALRINGTPTIIIGNDLYVGALPYDTLAAIVEHHLGHETPAQVRAPKS